MKKEYKTGDKVIVYLKKSDFYMVGNDVTANYSNPFDCPLARAVKRTFKTKDVRVSPGDWGVRINDDDWSNSGEWGIEIADIVGGNLHNGDETRYFVTLTKNKFSELI
jgi:hypothetical protein